MRFVIIFMLLAFLAGCASQTAVDIQAPPLAEPIGIGGGTRDTTIAAYGPIHQITLRPGIVRVESVHLSFSVTGHLAALYVMPGDEVQEGDLLARLNAEELVDAIQTLEANIAHMNQSHRLAQDMFVYEVALLRLDYSSATRQAAETLTEAAQNEAIRLMLEIENAEILHRQRQELHALDIADARRRLDELQERLPQTELRAPYSGVITLVMQTARDSWVAADAPLIYINHSPEVFVNYAGTSLPHRLAHAQKITASINGQEYEMYYVPMTREETIEARRRGLPERWRFNFVQGQPPLGAYASILFYTVYIQDALRIPVNAMFFMDGVGSYVYRVQNDELIMTPVRAGARSASFVQILEGLEEGDEVFVS